MQNKLLQEPICSCCGWQFGYNNPAHIERYRAEWVKAGGNWFLSNKRPLHWNIAVQLARIGLTVDDTQRTLMANPA